ncbi:MAG: T9SS type A sorting domain-containing protein, partial [Dysgonamonadaceae bacterium]|nr:T9SS type A sorting domain-containing protein [Dysgonamonadaceae bacterium]
ALNDAGNTGGYAQECYFSGTINGADHTGGFIGLNNTATSANAIVNCSAYADITVSGDTVGGFIGTAKTGGQEVKASFFYGTIDKGEATIAGSFIGSNEGNIPFTLSYAQEISGLNPAGDATTTDGITAVAEANLKQKSSYSNDLFGSPYFMQMVNGKTWPYTGSQTAPFEITSLTGTQLQGKLVDTGLGITLFKNYKPVYTGAIGEGTWSYTFPEALEDGDIITAIVNTETTLEDASYPVSQTYAAGNGIIAVTPDEELEVYPNPVAGELYLKGSCLQEGETVTISDLSGRTVLNAQLSILHPVKVSHLPEGVYLLQVGGKVVKLVKK